MTRRRRTDLISLSLTAVVRVRSNVNRYDMTVIHRSDLGGLEERN